MKELLIVFVLVFSISLFPSDYKIEQNHFISKQYGFEIVKPIRWSFVEASSNDNNLIIKLVDSDWTAYIQKPNMRIESYENGMDFFDFIKKVEQDILYDGFTRIGTSIIKINGHNFVKSSFVFHNNEANQPDLYLDYYFIQLAKYKLVFACGGYNPSYMRYFYLILNTFSIL